jgi:hypothetical protein
MGWIGQHWQPNGRPRSTKLEVPKLTLVYSVLFECFCSHDALFMTVSSILSFHPLQHGLQMVGSLVLSHKMSENDILQPVNVGRMSASMNRTLFKVISICSLS